MSRSDKILKIISTILEFGDDKLDAVEDAVNACSKVQMLQNLSDSTYTQQDHSE